MAGALDDLRAQYQRIQLVFEGDAPDVQGAMRRARIACSRQGRVLTILSSIARRRRDRRKLRGYAPASIDVSPVTLKDIFLESVRTED